MSHYISCPACGIDYNKHKGLTTLCEETQKTKSSVTGTEAKVCHDIGLRQQLGIRKYGTTVREKSLPLDEWLQHAYEECLDQAIYLKRAMEEMDKLNQAPQP